MQTFQDVCFICKKLLLVLQALHSSYFYYSFVFFFDNHLEAVAFLETYSKYLFHSTDVLNSVLDKSVHSLSSINFHINADGLANLSMSEYKACSDLVTAKLL